MTMAIVYDTGKSHFIMSTCPTIFVMVPYTVLENFTSYWIKRCQWPLNQHLWKLPWHSTDSIKQHVQGRREEGVKRARGGGRECKILSQLPDTASSDPSNSLMKLKPHHLSLLIFHNTKVPPDHLLSIDVLGHHLSQLWT